MVEIDCLQLLKELVKCPSPSRHEAGTAQVLMAAMESSGAVPRRLHNNVWCVKKGWIAGAPTLLLNSHHDTVPPCTGWSRDPYVPHVTDGRLYGLGGNDAGASVVSLIHTFLALGDEPLPFNVVLALSAEEEVSGADGLRALLPELVAQGLAPTMAIIGEPTGMQPAVAERGLVVLDCISHGVAGHAARHEGVNALYMALDDIATLRHLALPHVSPVLGPVGINVTMIEAGTRHNVIPDTCRWVVDVRTTDAYSNEETVALLQKAVKAEAVPRSTRIHPSAIDVEQPLVKACAQLGLKAFASSTSSDMSALPTVPSIKIGPGLSARSHTADEFVLLDEISRAIDIYPRIIRNLATILQ